MTTTTEAPYTESTEGRVYTVTGGDWESVLGRGELEDERIVVNMGPQHPSTHGVLRLVLELEGETVTAMRPVIGYLHTGIEKNCEFRTWVQGVTFVTRADYVAPLHNEAAYCLGVEKLLGITEEIPQRATTIRVMLLELNRIASHIIWAATGGMEMGALTAMTNGFRDRELILDVFEAITGLRMNHAYIRPGGLAQDLPEGALEKVEDLVRILPGRFDGLEKLLTDNPVWKARLSGTGFLDTQACLALGVTGPLLRSTGLPWDLRRTQPYLGYETYDFDVITETEGDNYSRYLVRVREMRESLKIVAQCVERLREPGPVMVADKKIAWPSQLALGGDGLGNSLEYIRKIMGTSMEALIHHFKLVTEGFRVPPGQVYVPTESPKGELGFHLVSGGGTRPHRVHFREPSFINLQAAPAMCEGSYVADIIASVASIDPIMGGVDR
jgi:NADH-quinone oxidoreductase subunit D